MRPTPRTAVTDHDQEEAYACRRPQGVFVATGDGATRSTGAIQRSKDGGQSWQMLPLPVEPNSPIWAFATHPAQPNRILACSQNGELFASHDAGDSWVKLRREFAEKPAPWPGRRINNCVLVACRPSASLSLLAGKPPDGRPLERAFRGWGEGHLALTPLPRRLTIRQTILLPGYGP